MFNIHGPKDTPPIFTFTNRSIAVLIDKQIASLRRSRETFSSDMQRVVSGEAATKLAPKMKRTYEKAIEDIDRRLRTAALWRSRLDMKSRRRILLTFDQAARILEEFSECTPKTLEEIERDATRASDEEQRTAA